MLRCLLPSGRGIPSHDALNNMMSAFDSFTFAACSTSWMNSLHNAGPDVTALGDKLWQLQERLSRRAREMKEMRNVQVIDGALNCAYLIYQFTEEQYKIVST